MNDFTYAELQTVKAALNFWKANVEDIQSEREDEYPSLFADAVPLNNDEIDLLLDRLEKEYTCH